MLRSPSPAGPWSTSTNNPGSCGMPTAAFAPNGTLFVICGNGHELKRLNPSTSKWQSVLKLDTPPRWEDPTLWFDRRGNWHIIYHVYALEPFSSGVERYSGHAWSTDGLQWSFSDDNRAPFGGTVVYSDSTSKTFSTRERPQMVFHGSDRTTPVGITSAVSPQPLGPWCNFCREGACSQCKTTPGRDWTYTIYQGLGSKL